MVYRNAGEAMKVGDLVTLSAAGSRQDQNWVMREYSTFGIIVAIQMNINLETAQPSLYKIKWYWKRQHHTMAF